MKAKAEQRSGQKLPALQAVSNFWVPQVEVSQVGRSGSESMSGGHREPRMTEARRSRKTQVLFEAPKWGSFFEPSTKTLVFSRAFVVFYPFFIV